MNAAGAMNDVCGVWTARLRAALPELMSIPPALSAVAKDASVLLHGSTTYGIDDVCSDLDLWLVMPEKLLPAFDAECPGRFIEFRLHGKIGHISAVSAKALAERMDCCDLPLIAELRHAQCISDPTGAGGELIRRALLPMPEAVRLAWTCYHYVEHRSEHRAADNPIERGDAPAALTALCSSINHALQAAMVLDGEPYPYVKWLARRAFATPTGSRLAAQVEAFITALGTGALHTQGPEARHPLNLKVREMRMILKEAAITAGFDRPWLDKWWLHLAPAKDGIKEIGWPK